MTDSFYSPLSPSQPLPPTTMVYLFQSRLLFFFLSPSRGGGEHWWKLGLSLIKSRLYRRQASSSTAGERRGMWGGCEPSVGADAGVGEEEKAGRRTLCSDVVLFRTFILRLLNAGFPRKPFRLPPSFSTNLCCIYFGSPNTCNNPSDVSLLL